MKFLLITHFDRSTSPRARFREVVDNAVLGEQAGSAGFHHGDGPTDKARRASLELFQSEVAPVLRRDLPSRPFTQLEGGA